MQNTTLNFNEFKSLEVVFQDATKQWKRILAQVQRVDSTKLLLVASNDKNRGITIPPDSILFINVYTNNGIYTADSRLLQSTYGTMLTHYEIVYPSNIRHAQRREYFRADMKVHFLANISKEKSLNVEVISATTKNICGKGLSFLYPSPIGSYSNIEVMFTIADKNIKTNAELIYSHKVQVAGSNKYIHALHFTTISRYYVDFIVKKCFLYQLECKKRGF